MKAKHTSIQKSYAFADAMYTFSEIGSNINKDYTVNQLKCHECDIFLKIFDGRIFAT